MSQPGPALLQKRSMLAAAGENWRAGICVGGSSGLDHRSCSSKLQTKYDIRLFVTRQKITSIHVLVTICLVSTRKYGIEGDGGTYLLRSIKDRPDPERKISTNVQDALNRHDGLLSLGNGAVWTSSRKTVLSGRGRLGQGQLCMRVEEGKVEFLKR
ncbi:hypothetical protein HYALB_00011149 [Hymenoscyphus albidus]|uniref:Uncharacterized protein n=1 Tax=Hymenoscyphus albidus TaxID=595503 RepID=A0A9N9LMA4_9HELO|nr:hypothetical protein HYALB_00011149 [Hymenoscyphus albidus]